MELPRRQRGDELLQPGEFLRLCQRLRGVAAGHDLTSVIACAFDHRTRMLPFIYADLHMVPAGVRAIGSAMLDVGFNKTRIVLQQWNRRFRPSQMRLDGRVPDIFMVSSMQIHSAACRSLIRDACTIDPMNRPLIIAGGPKVNYEPWGVFSDNPREPWGADVAVTGEEFVLLSLLEVLLSERGRNEPLRSTFLRARDTGMLNGVPGLVFACTKKGGTVERLVDTGVQRLLGDLDELPHPVLGFRILEPPSRRTTLASDPLPTNRVRRYSPLGSLVMTFGCKFACPYCPIPAYNQRQYRVKSGERIADEFRRIYDEYGIRNFFSSDDNFFNNKDRTLAIVEQLSRTEVGGVPIRKKIRWGTEVTVHDTLQMKEHLSTVRRAGVRSLWLGVEDMTATLVKKGQSVSKTTEAFQLLSRHGISPMPMMMHHDEQPLLSRGPKPYGLLNQIRLMRKAGAISMQVLMLVPATGSKLFSGTYTSGMAFESVGDRKVEEHMLGGMYVVASNHPKPWRKQLNLLLAYAYFYNPLRMMAAIVKPKSKLYLADALWQGLGMWGLLRTARRTLGWNLRLLGGTILRRSAPPTSSIPMQAPDGSTASHALPEILEPEGIQPKPWPHAAASAPSMPLPVLQ
jgi:radical SAM superfamily enzyme YgiQ (UPF0313 family)